MHNFIYDHETLEDAVFLCSKCGQELGFNKEGLGEPHATPNGMAWDIPADHDQYIGPCNE